MFFGAKNFNELKNVSESYFKILHAKNSKHFVAIFAVSQNFKNNKLNM